jgi:signal transduction histidine kinase
MKTQTKLVLAQGGVTLAAVLLAGLVMAYLSGELSTTLIFYIVLATAIGLALAVWTTRPLARRLQRILEISQAWRRGNLSLRIDEDQTDEIGQLAEQLDLLVEHLEQNEQDLSELQERNTRLTDQVRALAVVEERNRLARELHDSVKQHLFSLAMTASAIRPRLETLEGVSEELIEMVNEVELAARTAQQETTRLIEDLRPGSLQERGLVATLNDYTLLFGAKEHLLVYLEVQGDEIPLHSSLGETLYRVAQEALHNVARHAQATRADLQLRFLPGEVTLSVRDNGIGFDTSQPHQGLGLANMQERLMAVGGRLVVKSRPGIGTTILAEIGLTRPADKLPDQVEKEELAFIPTIDNWGWLGQRLVIPVGQTWPWLLADLKHLRRPILEPNDVPISLLKRAGVLGLGKGYILQLGDQPRQRIRIRSSRRGYEWRCEAADWLLRDYGGITSRMVLLRNGQPLAAMQYRGRQMHSWCEIVFDGRGYRLSHVQNQNGRCHLIDHTGEELLWIESDGEPNIQLSRPLPLTLVLMVVVRAMEESK